MNVNNVDLHGIKRGRGRPPGVSKDLKKMQHKDLFEYCGIKRGRGRPRKNVETASKSGSSVTNDKAQNNHPPKTEHKR